MGDRAHVAGAAPSRVASSEVATAGSPWLFGPGVDLWIGCGLAYVLTLPLLILLTETAGISSWPVACVAILTLAINGPHYGATLIRVYEQRADRVKYVFFTLYLTLAIVAAFVVGLHSAWLGSALITLYISWSPWHFSGQNYGLAVMFLRRSDIAVPPLAVRLLYFSFLLSFGLALLAVHVQESTAIYAPGVSAAAGSYEVLRLGIPRPVAQGLFAAFASAYLGCLFAATRLLRRVAPWRTLAPVGLLVLTQSLWFVVPALLEFARDLPAYALPFAAVWISTAHSAQYLWVTAYYARRGGRHDRPGSFLAKALLAGTVATVLPGVLFMPALLGTVSWNAGLAALAAAVVNLHHFVLDGAIWKLRDGRVARVLVRSENVPIGEPPAHSWIAKTIWAGGAVLLLVPIVEVFEILSVSRPVEATRLERAAQRLGWIGRDHPEVWVRLGGERQHTGDIAGAIDAYRESLFHTPGHPEASSHLAWLLAVYHGEDPASAEEALRLAELASEHARQQNPIFLDTLAVAQAANGQFDEAIGSAKRARAIARARGSTRLVKALERRLALYEEHRPFRRKLAQ